MKKLSWILLLFLFVPLHAQEAMRVRDVRQRIDSMHYVMNDYRDSIRNEIKVYKDSVRQVRRHANDAMPHELRVGWGDQMFETMAWHNTGYYTGLPEDYQEAYNENYRYTQHYFIEYLYSLNYWYSFGLMVDYSGVIWDQVWRNGKGKELDRLENRAFHNIAIVPTVNFSYFQHDYVSLYSAFGVGVNVNTGTELDYKNRQTVAAPVVNITLLGLCVGKGRWYGALEVGGMLSLNGKDELYMLGSRLFTASIGVRL